MTVSNSLRRLVLLLLALVFISPPSKADRTYTLNHGDREDPRIAITVDDCRNIEWVAACVSLCREYQIPMTFFVLGQSLREEDRDVWLDALDAGCEIGNHSYSHPDLTSLTPRQIMWQLNHTQERLDAVLGRSYPMRLMRPPYGHVLQRGTINVVTPVALAAGYEYVVLWDVSQTDPEKALPDVKNGSILLFHTIQKDVRCLEILIPALLEKGFVPVTAGDLLGLGPLATDGDLASAGSDQPQTPSDLPD